MYKILRNCAGSFEIPLAGFQTPPMGGFKKAPLLF